MFCQNTLVFSSVGPLHPCQRETIPRLHTENLSHNWRLQKRNRAKNHFLVRPQYCTPFPLQSSVFQDFLVLLLLWCFVLLSCLPTRLFSCQMTRRTMEEPSPVLVLVPTTEPPTVSPSLSRRGAQRTTCQDMLWSSLAPAVKVTPASQVSSGASWLEAANL